MYEITYRSISTSDMGVYVEHRPDVPASIERVDKVTIPGRDGDFLIRENGWEDIEIEGEMAFRTQADQWFSRWRSVKRWLTGNGKLVFADDASFFYWVKNVTVSEAERELRKHGRFRVTFLCEAFHYDVEGAELAALPASGKLENPYELPAYPIYQITGEGNCVLTVNDYELTANVGQNLMIDTKRQIAYRIDGTPQNTLVTGEYDKLLLPSGESEIAISSGFTLKIQPNWRCI